MTDKKCCKKPKCNSKQSKCQKKDFMFSPLFWKLLIVINFLIIVLRVSYLQSFNFDSKLLYFILFLELQIVSFYILLISAVHIITALYNLLLLDKYYLIQLFSKRITNRFMKWLTLVNTDNILFRLWCIFCLFIITTLMIFIGGSYMFVVGLCVPILLGYTKF
jgi:hypothetical protein